jgi:hypothetical protein
MIELKGKVAKGKLGTSQLAPLILGAVIRAGKDAFVIPPCLKGSFNLIGLSQAAKSWGY